MNCPECGHLNQKQARFCEACGGKLARPTATRSAAARSSGPAAAAGTTCPACGYSNRSSVRFCEECGAPLALPAPKATPPKPRPVSASGAAAIRCPACGFPNRGGVQFCEECGASLLARPVPAAPPARPAVRRRAGIPVWLRAAGRMVIRFALSSLSGYAMGKLGMLVLNALIQAVS